MALRNFHRYVAEASSREGRRLGELPLTPDFTPAGEWSHLQGVRRGVLPALAHHGPGAVEPIFDGAPGPPYVAGIRVHFDAAEPAYELPMIPWSYFQPCVECTATRLVEDGTLRTGESFVYRISAFPVPGEHPVTDAAPRGAVHESPAPLALDSAPLASRLAHVERLCQAAWSAADLPLFVQPDVLDEATERARAAPDHETGGILVGHLVRDTDSPELYVEITAQIPALHARAGRTHLSFSPETWSAVSDALALRRRDEMWLGWWHSHPFFCRHCDAARRRLCTLSRPFFSRDDCELHRAVFDTAFSVALLLSNVGEGSLRYDWFGWRHGSIAPRGCYLLSREKEPAPTAHTESGTAPAARVLSINEGSYEH
jgi:proteasome lid subunit RPN8/RPN11